MGDQVLDASLAGDQFTHGLFRDPGPNWSVEGVSYNGETDQIEALLPSILCLWVVVNPYHVLGLQPLLATHRRSEVLRAAILWRLRRNEDVLPITSAVYFNIAARIAAPESLVVLSHSRQPPPSAYRSFWESR